MFKLENQNLVPSLEQTTYHTIKIATQEQSPRDERKSRGRAGKPTFACGCVCDGNDAVDRNLAAFPEQWKVIIHLYVFPATATP
jgi:hypothetical protein